MTTIPTYKAPSFSCPKCKVLAHQRWLPFERYYNRPQIAFKNDNDYSGSYLEIAICANCDEYSIWYEEKMIYPQVLLVVSPHEKMPEKLVKYYTEASQILNFSPRGSAAILRLLLQELMIYLGEPGKNINNDIGSLVRKGLPIQIQQALDTVRVIGNNAVHPGQLDLEDNEDIAKSLFELINIIVDHQIAQPQKIEELYARLPQNLLDGINDRDKEKTPK